MADVKVENEANVVASLVGTEISYVVQTPSGTPTPGQVTKAVEKAYYNSAPTLTGTATIDRILPTVSSAANPTSLDWTATKDEIAWTFSAGQTITLSNVPSTAGARKTIRAVASSGGPHTLAFTGGTILPSGDTISVPSGGGTTIITLESIGGGAFTVSQRIGWTDVYGTTAGVQAVLAAPGAIGGTTPAAITGTTIQANTGFVPDVNDGAYLGTSSLGFSDLFLAEGGVVNWDNGDVTITQTGDALAIAGTTSVTIGGAEIRLGGKTTVPLAASALVPATTNGPAKAQIETTTNKVNLEVLDFDGATAESAYFTIPMPKAYNNGTVTFEVIWTTTNTGTAGVAWTLAGGALSDNDTIDTALGTAVAVTDAGQSSNAKAYKTDESSAVTIAGTPAAGDLVVFKLARDPSNGSDTMTEDARLIGLRLFFTTDKANDA